jgi:hypothetical protein
MKKMPRGGAGADLLFFLFFLVVLGVVWAVTGGPHRDISHAGPFLNLPFPLGNGTAYTVPSVPIPNGQPAPQNTGGPTTNDTLSGIIGYFRGGGSSGVKATSPYAQYVTLSYSNAQSTDPKTEYVTIRISQNLTGQLPISAWRIESPVSLNGAALGPASPLPISGTIAESPVTVGAGATINIISGTSPEGESFRKNICTGYFTNAQSFSPTLSTDCPRPSDELKKAALQGFFPTDACVSYIDNVSACHIPSQIPPSLGDQCLSFIAATLNYQGCVNLHQNDANFYKNEWYLYLDRTSEMWRSSNEQINLLDENGKVVASVSY